MDTATQTHAPRQLAFDLVPPEKLRENIALQRWVLPMVTRACEYSFGRFDPETVLASCAGLNPEWIAQLWITGYRGGGEPPTIEAAVVTCISTYPTGRKVMDIVLVGGAGAKDWMAFEDKLSEWAALQGCAEVQVIGRRGWERHLGSPWRESARIYTRLLKPAVQEGVDDGQG